MMGGGWCGWRPCFEFPLVNQKMQMLHKMDTSRAISLAVATTLGACLLYRIATTAPPSSAEDEGAAEALAAAVREANAKAAAAEQRAAKAELRVHALERRLRLLRDERHEQQQRDKEPLRCEEAGRQLPDGAAPLVRALSPQEDQHAQEHQPLIDCGARDRGDSVGMGLVITPAPHLFAAADAAGSLESAALPRSGLPSGGAGAAMADDLAASLYFASEQGRTDKVTRLVGLGVPPSGAMAQGVTPLYAAARNGHVDVALVLLDAGAAVDGAAEDGSTPLIKAAQKGHVHLVRLLLERGAKPGRPNYQGVTPLIVACEQGFAAIVALLVASAEASAAKATAAAAAAVVPLSSFVDQHEAKGLTPLYIASMKGHVEVAALLLRGGASVALATPWGTPAEVAKRKGHVRVLALLLEAEVAVAEATRAEAREAAPSPSPLKKKNRSA